MSDKKRVTNSNRPEKNRVSGTIKKLQNQLAAVQKKLKEKKAAAKPKTTGPKKRGEVGSRMLAGRMTTIAKSRASADEKRAKITADNVKKRAAIIEAETAVGAENLKKMMKAIAKREQEKRGNKRKPTGQSPRGSGVAKLGSSGTRKRTNIRAKAAATTKRKRSGNVQKRIESKK
jgi:hypothetical protein